MSVKSELLEIIKEDESIIIAEIMSDDMKKGILECTCSSPFALII